MQQDMQEKRFVETFSEYGDAIFRFCMVKVSNVQQAEDMTQEVFMRYWQYLRDGKEITIARALLYTIANNLAKDWYKKHKAVSLDESLADAHEPQDVAADPDTSAAYAEVLRTLDGLAPADKELLLLRYVEGLPPKDIAVALEESANTISVRLNRATKRLQQKLGI